MIRPGRPGDVAAIGALNTSYRLELAAAGRPEERPADVWRRWLDRRISAGDVRVAAEDEAVVGYIAWELQRLEQGRALAVRDLYVRPGERGLRHGAGLLARALDRARSDGVMQIEVDGRPGRRGRTRPGGRLGLRANRRPSDPPHLRRGLETAHHASCRAARGRARNRDVVAVLVPGTKSATGLC